MKNIQHLKAYVQMHPDNKMAWYLLGKEYYKNGQHGKANYCFNQAGDVYEAFEHSKVPAEMLREYEEGLLQAERERVGKRKKIRRALLALVFLLMIAIPSAAAPGLVRQWEADGASAAEDSDTVDPVEVPAIAVPGNSQTLAKSTLAFTAVESGGASSAGKLLVTMLGRGQPGSKTAVLGMKRQGEWLIWKKRLPLITALEKKGNGAIEYQSYEPAVCNCEPPEHGELAKRAGEWQDAQEEQAVLWSAMKAYQSAKGKLPDSLKELAGPFPGNWLGGTTPTMKQAFKPLRAAASPGASGNQPEQPATSQATQGTDESGSGASGGTQGQPFFASPLTIIVDKQTHRLAIVSGSVMLRNYEVGLGGDRTPEGRFAISDKVVNPNGHDNGEFGSRGMQLSDTNYAIHGTNDLNSIGKDESLGCIRMRRGDVEELFALAPKGTKVEISRGVLPAELLLPKERFSSATSENQTNPHKKYHWLN
ncbi:L,D-transpeptidase family protein [Paenibacillus sp. NPDC057934]|uniref:L,D-transpeptidase family protein n=1 Tax=Paenibacillus sp. NPDC057934 TaxID=3346282 RepID=UPI0036DC3D1A